MSPERKKAYLYLMDHLARGVKGLHIAPLQSRSLFPWQVCKDCDSHLASVNRWISEMGTQLALLTKATLDDFSHFDEQSFWSTVDDGGYLLDTFQHFEVRVLRQVETGSWMPKSCRSLDEVVTRLRSWHRDIADYHALALIEEATHQLEDFPPNQEVVDVAVNILESGLDMKTLNPLALCPEMLYFLLGHLKAPRYAALVKKLHHHKPSFITNQLIP
jgi:hypothetical protein